MKKILILFLFAIVFFSCEKTTHDKISFEINQGWQFHQVDSGQWMPAVVPGCVHTDLISNKKIEDPFYRTNERDIQWIDKKDWEYKTTFEVNKNTLSKERVELYFKGLDTYSKVYVNDSLILTTDNMFREWTVDCKNILSPGENTLRIYFDSPIRRAEALYDQQGYEVPVSENDLAELGGLGKKRVSVYSRKAGYHFGWDWGPRLVSSGIWRPVILNAWNDAVIRSLKIEQNKIEKEKAHLTADLELESTQGGKRSIVLLVNKQIVAKTEVDLKQGISIIPVSFSIVNPALWWPTGYGDPTLYTVSAQIMKGDLLLDEKQDRIGLRTIEVVQTPDSIGKSFYFKINGVPMFMKGANYIPQDIFITRVTRQQYETMINNTTAANMNMLRVWGGGVYGDDMLYDLCDEKGILVWQDFMFACSLFPNYPGYYENIRKEAVDNVKRMRNHPSIALWCGNNECLDAMNWYKHQTTKTFLGIMQKTYDTIFHSILPSVINIEDSSRFYWFASPCAAKGELSDWKRGDVHYWGVWWGKEPFVNYRKQVGRFMSEYGFQSFPEISTIKKYSVEADWDIYSEVMKHHQRSSIGNGTIDLYMKRDYNKPKDFQSYLYVNQVLQAEGVKFAMEGHRLHKPVCMGTLFWQIDDCWPVASWSSIDYYGKWKALHYYAKAAYEPVHVILWRNNNKMNVNIISDHLKKEEGTLMLKLMDFNGKEYWSKKMDAKVDSNGNLQAFNMNEKELIGTADTSNLLLQAQFSNNGHIISENHIFLASPKYMVLPDVNMKPSFRFSNNKVEIILHSDVLAKNVLLQCDKGFFSDNYFDILPGETKTITLSLSADEKVSEEDIKILTLKDAF